MDFLDKLYSNDYFGIGLFIVIAVLVVTFLVILFFGKKDEKKRKIEETNSVSEVNDAAYGFKDVSVPTPVETPISPVPEPVAPINLEPNPVAPINLEANMVGENVNPIPISEPINPVVEPIASPTSVVTPVPVEPITPVNLNAPVTPVVEPINTNSQVITPIVEPVTPAIEPIKINIPEEPVNNTTISPIIEEKVEPIVINSAAVPTPQLNEVKEVPNTYYHEPEKLEVKPVAVPNIDFDAIAKSISQELEELENNTQKANADSNESNKPREQFSSVYVSKPTNTNTVPKTKVVLPKKIVLPEVKQDTEIEPESYQI